jgi:hypothetical protein
VPVVPDVRMIALPDSFGGTTLDGSPRSISSSSVGSFVSPSGSLQEM